MQAMGQSKISRDITNTYSKQLHIVTDLQDYFTNYRNQLHSDELNTFSLIGPNDEHRKKFKTLFKNLKLHQFNPQQLQLSTKESRGIAVMLGMAICDALGASTEFQSFKKTGLGLIKDSFKDIKDAIQNKRLQPRHGHIGVWTDDASMGLAMAYSLMLKKYELDPVNTRFMFHLWLEHGLGNGGRHHSIGLGGNISISMREFDKSNPKLARTAQGNQDNNGNGSLMRLAPMPITFCDDPIKAAKAAQDQSLTTHNGLEAKECSRLMTQIIISLIHRKEGEEIKNILIKTCDKFQSEQAPSVVCLARGQMQTQAMMNQSMKTQSFTKWNKGLKDRNWNWRDLQFTYSPTRTAQYSGYAGSYCMDGLAMALHMVYYTNSFKECAVKCADMGGDCDTVGSIAGQIAGAAYGIGAEMLKLYSEMEDYVSERYEVFLVGYKLINRIPMDDFLESKVENVLQNQIETEENEKVPMC